MNKKTNNFIIKNLIRDKNNNYSPNIVYYKSVSDIEENAIIVIVGKKIFLKALFVLFYSLVNFKKFEKNCFLLFDFGHTIFGNNFIPDWPGKYTNQSFFKNFLAWLKKFNYILFFRRNLFLIFYKFN